MVMDQMYVERLEQIRELLEEIQLLRDDLGDLTKDPAASIEKLETIRGTLEEIQLSQDDLEG